MLSRRVKTTGAERRPDEIDRDDRESAVVSCSAVTIMGGMIRKITKK